MESFPKRRWPITPVLLSSTRRCWERMEEPLLAMKADGSYLSRQLVAGSETLHIIWDTDEELYYVIWEG